MSIFGKLLKTAVDVVTVPVSVAADVITLGGAINERKNTHTGDHLRCVVNDIEKLYDEIEKL